MKSRLFRRLVPVLLTMGFCAHGEDVRELQVGIAGHAFDHLGAIGEQAEAAAASGSTIIYATGVGGLGYLGLPVEHELHQAKEASKTYLRNARAHGIQLAIGYVCATSIVKLETFDKNWSEEFRAGFRSVPEKWLQQGRNGAPLASWYGGDYRPACMNNPDWRTYEKQIVRLQLESGHDGVFFDNPTVHPQGCYCEHCMRKFAVFLAARGTFPDASKDESLESLRQLAASRPEDFMRFRATIARDFLAEMRSYARTINPKALITCNNSLNTPEAFFSQCRTYAYNIYEMSKAEDFVVVEDMASQPRILADGSVREYGPVYELLHAISHRKPVVAVTICDGDYHTPGNLMRLAMAEAAAHGASYLSWPTWPENVRKKMITGVQPQAELLRRNADLLNESEQRTDAVLFLPFRRWTETADCPPLNIARTLNREHVQFKAVCEDDLAGVLAAKSRPVLIVESAGVLLQAEKELVDRYKSSGGQVIFADQPSWLAELREVIKVPSITAEGKPNVRVVVRDQPARTIVHLLNLNVQRVSSFEDKVEVIADVHLRIRTPLMQVRTVKALSADEGSEVTVPFTQSTNGSGALIELALPKLVVSTILVIE